MKKIVLLILLLLVGTFFWWQGRKAKQNPASEKLQVVVSGYVPYTLAYQLGGERISLSMLLPTNAEPHAFEPTPGAILSVRNADIFAYISEQIEPWVKDLLDSIQSGTKIVEAADQVGPAEDPHVWMDFANVRHIAAALARAFVEQDPENQTYYEEKFMAFQREIDALEASFLTGLKNCHSREVVHVGHLAFENLAKKYRLALFPLAGVSHAGEHSAHKLTGLVNLIRDKKIKAIFTEETLSPRLAAIVAEETGVRVYPLYTVEHVSKQDFEQHVTYGELMRRNLTSLQGGLVCPSL